MILHFLTDIPLVFEIENKIYNVFYKKHLKVENMNQLFVKVFIQGDYQTIYSPFTFCISQTKNELSCNNNLVQIYKLSDDEFYIFVSALIKDNNIIYSKDDFLIKNGTTIYSNNNKVYFTNFYAINNTILNKFNMDFIMLKGINQNLLIAINNNKVCLCKKYNIVEFNNKGFTLLINQNDILKQGLVIEYEINNEQINVLSEHSVYVKKPEKLTNQHLIVPCFLECGKVGNKKMIENFLSPELKKHFSIANFNQFFGNFKKYEIYNFNNEQVKVVLFYNNHCKLFTFKLVNSLIDNVD